MSGHNCVFMLEYHIPFKHYVSASLKARARHIMFYVLTVNKRSTHKRQCFMYITPF